MMKAQSGLVISNKNIGTFLNFPEGVIPLFVVADVNGDGVVDAADEAMLKKAILNGKTAALPCEAAGDLNLDEQVNGDDVKMLHDWLQKSPTVKIPALYATTSLPCRNPNAFVAATLSASPGSSAFIRFFRAGLNTKTCRARIHAGSASVVASPTGDGFDVRVFGNAKPGKLIVVLLSIPNGRNYYYSIPVVP